MINYFVEDLDFQLNEQEAIDKWLFKIAADEAASIETLNYIFCSDKYLHTINVDYLSHDTYTDIITFDNSQNKKQIESDIFISIERVRENALDFEVSFDQELRRVMAHGLLHLLGYKDKTESEKSIMREKEEACLSLLH